MSDAGEMVRVQSRDGFEFAAYNVEPEGERKGGVIVIQEIFGLSTHIREMADRFAAAGYEAIAPSMYDRAAPGFVVQPPDVAAGMARGFELATGNGPKNAMNDVGACFDLMKARGPVFVAGYCYGGSMSWLAAATIPGLAAASCYYGGSIHQMLDQKPLCPVICHFGAKDAHIPLVGAVDKVQAACPDIPVHIYDADHGFARRNSASYDAAADALAWRRTLELFAAHG
jgi:carboxymethylenebutenolidase